MIQDGNLDVIVTMCMVTITKVTDLREDASCNLLTHQRFLDILLRLSKLLFEFVILCHRLSHNHSRHSNHPRLLWKNSKQSGLIAC